MAGVQLVVRSRGKGVVTIIVPPLPLACSPVPGRDDLLAPGELELGTAQRLLRLWGGRQRGPSTCHNKRRSTASKRRAAVPTRPSHVRAHSSRACRPIGTAEQPTKRNYGSTHALSLPSHPPGAIMWICALTLTLSFSAAVPLAPQCHAHCATHHRRVVVLAADGQQHLADDHTRARAHGLWKEERIQGSEGRRLVALT